jgi:hypothetical protein
MYHVIFFSLHFPFCPHDIHANVTATDCTIANTEMHNCTTPINTIANANAKCQCLDPSGPSDPDSSED